MLISQIYGALENDTTHPPILDRVRRVKEELEKAKCCSAEGYRSVDAIFAPKIATLNKLLQLIKSKGMTFRNMLEIQKFIYKECDLF